MNSPDPTNEPAADGVSFVQIWTMPDQASIDGWLQTMHERIHVLTGLPGFRSMSLYRGIDERHVAVHAEWDTIAHLLAGRQDEPARAAHAELVQWGHDIGNAYLLDRTYLPDEQSHTQTGLDATR
jgi:heme-degrading monooxygenase HmoA